METSFHLFTDKGFARTTISDIVHEAGMAKGTFYLYFHDKYDLQEKLITHKAAQLLEHALHSSGYENYSRTDDRVIALTDDILNQVNNDKKLLRFINKNISWGLFRRFFSDTETDVLKEFIDILPPCDDPKRQEIIIYTIIELVSSTCYEVILKGTPVDLEEYKPFLFHCIRTIINSLPDNTDPEAVPADVKGE